LPERFADTCAVADKQQTPIMQSINADKEEPALGIFNPR